MVKKIVSAVIIMAASVLAASAQIRFRYDVDFSFMFDNREYDRSSFQPSGTMTGIRLAPAVGFDAALGRTGHRLMAGVDALSQFGTTGREIQAGLLCWYQLGMSSGDTSFRLTAGLMPRKMSEGEWSPLFFSDSHKFYDNRLDGLLLSWKRPKSRFELGLDWMGMYGQSRREEFMVFASGKISPLRWLKIGYEAYMLHYACSGDVPQVNDNVLAEPYITFDFAPLTGLQALSLRTGWIQAWQRDRENVGHAVAPYAGEAVVTLQHWGAGVRNSFVLGRDLMPYGNRIDAAGVPYAGNYYLGDPFYGLVDPGSAAWKDLADGSTSDIRGGLYDRLELYWAPKICAGLDLRLSLFFHFHHRQYSGTNQMFTLVFNLDELTSTIKARKAAGNPDR